MKKDCPHNGLPCIIKKIAKRWRCHRVAPRVVRYCPAERIGVKVIDRN